MKRVLAIVFGLAASSCAVSPSEDVSAPAPAPPSRAPDTTASAPLEAPACTTDGCEARSAPPFAAPVCEATAIAFVPTAAGAEAHVAGVTPAAPSQHASTCGGGSAGDVMYALTTSGPGRATVRIDADYPAIVSARAACGDASSEIGCTEVTSTGGGAAVLDVALPSSGTFFVLVDGFAGTTGTFDLDVAFAPAICGNGRAEVPEACDDGNAVAGDGCSAACGLEPGGILARCPGQPFRLSGQPGATRRLSLTGTTADGEKTLVSKGCGSSGGKNVVYALRSDVDGTARLELAASYPKAGLHMRSDCGSSDYELACAARDTPGGLVAEASVQKDAWFYAIVDGDLDAAGAFVLDVSVVPSSP